MENKFLVSPEEEMIINSQSQECQTIYYDQDVSLRPKCPVVRNTRFQQNFSSLNLPSSNTLQIPNISILDTMVYRVVLGPLTDVCLPLGWGYLLVNRVDVRYGASTVLTFNKNQILADLLLKADSKEKQDYLLRLGGDEISATTASDSEAVCFLNVLTSRIRQATAKLPYDSNLLSQPVQITVYFDAVSSICGGTGTAPTSMVDGSFACSQLDFKNMMDSLKGEMTADPMVEYNHFLVYRQDVSQQFTGSNNANSPVNLTLTGFRWGTLLSVSFVVVQNGNINTSSPNAKNPFLCERLSNINLVYNGQVLHRSLGHTEELFQMANRELPPIVSYSTLSGSASPFTSTATNIYIYKLDLSQFASEISEGHLQSGINIGSNVMNLQFNTETNNTYSIFLGYDYNSAIRVSKGGAEVNFVY